MDKTGKKAIHRTICQAHKVKSNYRKNNTKSSHSRFNCAVILSLCDIFFTVISLSTYLCVIVFDLVMVHALYNLKNQSEHALNISSGPALWFWIACGCLFVSFLATQIISMHWCAHEFKSGVANRAKAYATTNMQSLADNHSDSDIVQTYLSSGTYIYSLLSEFVPLIMLHVLQLHVVWRHCKMFLTAQMMDQEMNDISIQVRQENEFCRLSILRLYQSILQSIPMFLLKVYILVTSYTHSTTSVFSYQNRGMLSFKPHTSSFNGTLPLELLLSSAGLSLFGLSWSLATYDKRIFYPTQFRNSKHQNRLHMTWPGIGIKLVANGLLFFSRSLVLLLLVLSCFYWVILVGSFHWLLMAIWLYRHRLVFQKKHIFKTDHLPLTFTKPPPFTKNTHAQYLIASKHLKTLKMDKHHLATRQHLITKTGNNGNECFKQKSENISSRGRQPLVSLLNKLMISVALGAIYIFVFMNLQAGNSKLRLTTYYMLIFIENTLMVTIWLHQAEVDSIKSRLVALLSCYLTFFLGVLLLIAYYRCLQHKLRSKCCHQFCQPNSLSLSFSVPTLISHSKHNAVNQPLLAQTKNFSENNYSNLHNLHYPPHTAHNDRSNKYVCKIHALKGPEVICIGCGTNIPNPIISTSGRNTTSSSRVTGEKFSTTNTSNEGGMGGCTRGIVSCYYPNKKDCRNNCPKTLKYPITQKIRDSPYDDAYVNEDKMGRLKPVFNLTPNKLNCSKCGPIILKYYACKHNSLPYKHKSVVKRGSK